MSFSHRVGHRRPITIALTTAAVVALALVGSGSVQAKPAPDAEALYIVQMRGEPLATYAGGVTGYSATKPAPGAKLDTRSSTATAYHGKLRADYRAALRGAGVADRKKVYDYGVALNGFAARLTTSDAAKLRKTAGVQYLWKNEIRHADTISTPRFLGIDGPGGVWAKQFGGDTRAGEGMIIGIIDSGIWPEVPSFAPLSEPRPDQAIINAKWNGTCDAGSDPNPANRVTCNNKLIGARWFDLGDIDRVPDEFLSPRDRNGHGSHTSSTAGGNHGVTAVIQGDTMGLATGMAPSARIAMYKGLYHQPDGGSSGTTVDLVAAINQAVDDGVDVINYSISGSRVFIVGPDELAFRNAAKAGVFVSASAGNTPGTSTVAHNSPWLMTVAASTHDRAYGKSVTLGNGATYTGVGVAAQAVASTGLVDSASAGSEFCELGELDATKVTGKIVLCKRGVNARVDKSAAVKMAGGVGMVLYDDPDIGAVADFHAVPSVHLDRASGLPIKAYITSNPAGATASLSVGFNPPVRAPAMAGFSSSGPALTTSDLLKPDITAPGVDVIAGYSPANGGSLFNQISGTSMSSPHVAGVAALLMQKYPGWSPMMVKSALMTGARPTDSSGGVIQRNGVNQTPLDFGAGHLRPGSAFDPGLVYDSDLEDWDRYACGIGQLQLVNPQRCNQVGAIDPSDLNYPSITVGDLPTKQTVTRTVTNVTGRAGVYQAKVEAPAGFTVKVSPSRLVIPPRRSATFKVTIERTTAVVGAWNFGSLTWRDGRGHEVRSPISVRQWTVTAPREISQTGTSGSTTYSGVPAFTGTLTAASHGLAEASVAVRHLVGTNIVFNPDTRIITPAVGTVDVTVPAGVKLARFATFDADYPAGTDLDLFVYVVGAGGELTQVGQSAGGTSDESFTFLAPGNYRVYVVQFGLATGVTEQDVMHYAYAVPAGAGSLTVAPASQPVTVTTAVNLTATWSGLTAGRRYLGVIQYGDGTNLFPPGLGGYTIVAVSG